MPAIATATLLVRLNGGTPQSGGIIANPGDVVQLVAQSYAGWGTPAPRWEILTYPDTWPTPSGWTLDTSSGVIYYLGTTPPSFTLPSSGDVTAGLFGVWRFALTVNGGVGQAGLIDKHNTAVELISTNGVRDLAYGERAEFNSKFAHAAKLATNNRLLDGAVGASLTLSSATPSTISSSTGAAGVSPNAERAGHTHQLTEATFRTVCGFITAAISMNSQRVTNVAAPAAGGDAVNKTYADGLVTFSTVAAALATANADIDLNGHTFTNLSNPTNGNDASTKEFEDKREYAFPYKVCARGASHANQSLSGALTEDGVTYVTGDIYLAKNQSTAAENGIYVVNTSGAWARHASMAADAYVANGVLVAVREGTANGGTGWMLNTPAPIILGTTSLTFKQTWSSVYTFGNGLTTTGLVVSVLADGDGSIVVSGSGVKVGILATDAQHGSRGGGAQHALAVAGSPGTAGFIGGVDIQAVQSRTASATASTMMLRDGSGGTSLAYLSSAPSSPLNPSSALGLIRALNEQTILAARDQADAADLELVKIYQNALTVGKDATTTVLTAKAAGTAKIQVNGVDLIIGTEDAIGIFDDPVLAGGDNLITLHPTASEPSTTLAGEMVNVYVSKGNLYVQSPDNLFTRVTHDVSGDPSTLTLINKYIAKKEQAAGSGTDVLLDIPLGTSSATMEIMITLHGKNVDTNFVRRRLVTINNQTAGNVVSTDTIGTDTDTIGDSCGASFAVSGTNYRISITSATLAIIKWVCYVEVKYNDM